MIEAHDRFTVDTAIHVGRELQALSPYWYEAPVQSTDITGLVEVARSQPIRVAAGERFTQVLSFGELLHTLSTSSSRRSSTAAECRAC